jgi:alpha-glucosidase (family GH31 glycosyl hydrolase)
MGGQPLAQRLHDKPPTWGAGGLASLIPDSIAQGLIGHAFVCPDMVGGGDLAVFDRTDVDAELFVRYAQCAALFPMMQFSASPSRVLDPPHLAAVLEAVALHQALVPDIIRLAKRAGRTGEPILRPLAFEHAGYDDVTDQFLLGEDILAAPVLERGASLRRVLLPPGRWIAADGAEYHGPRAIDLPVTLTSIPWFRRGR